MEPCYRKPPSNILRVGGEDLGISGLDVVIEKGLEHIDSTDDEQKQALLSELKARNYVPSSVETEYMAAVWVDYKKARIIRRDQLEASYKGIPREEISWYPKVDPGKCSACSSCVEFCVQGVFTFDGKSHVTRPYNCVVGNTSCRAFCPEKAITFPTQTELRESLKRLREKYNVKP